MTIAIPGKIYKHLWTPSDAVVEEVKDNMVKVSFFFNGRSFTLPLEHFLDNFEPEPVGEMWSETNEDKSSASQSQEV